MWLEMLAQVRVPPARTDRAESTAGRTGPSASGASSSTGKFGDDHLVR